MAGQPGRGRTTAEEWPQSLYGFPQSSPQYLQSTHCMVHPAGGSGHSRKDDTRGPSAQGTHIPLGETEHRARQEGGVVFFQLGAGASLSGEVTLNRDVNGRKE